MNHLRSKQKSGTFVLLLFLTAQIILPVFCCCGFTQKPGKLTGVETVSGSCPSCVKHQANKGLPSQISETGDSHDCPCKTRIAKQLITNTKAVIQTELERSLDVPKHNIMALEIVADLIVIKQSYTSPLQPAKKHSQTSQSFTCSWIC